MTSLKGLWGCSILSTILDFKGMNMADVTIITVNYNTRRFIELCIKSIFKNTMMPYRMIVVDNGSTDGSIEYLRKINEIILVTRRTRLSASEHGRAIDQVLYRSGYINTPLICTIDSDAFAAKKGWLSELNKQRGAHFAVGYEHFREPHYLHPACMLFDYNKLLKIGKPSFALIKTRNTFIDTGIAVSKAALDHGEVLVGARNIDALVPHRWCATRVLRISGDKKLDNRITRSEFNEETDQWFNRADVRQILS